MSVGISVRHNHYHRLGTALSDEVVQYVLCASQARPGVFVASASVKKVKHRIASLPVFVACRSVDGHSAVGSCLVAVIPDLAEVSVRHVVSLIVVGLSATYDKVARKVGHVSVDVGIGQIQGLHSVHYEVIVVEFAGQGLAPSPESGRIARHRLVSVRTEAHHFHFRGIGCVEPQGYLAGSVVHLRRNQLGSGPNGFLSRGADQEKRTACQCEEKSFHLFIFHLIIHSSTRHASSPRANSSLSRCCPMNTSFCILSP